MPIADWSVENMKPDVTPYGVSLNDSLSSEKNLKVTIKCNSIDLTLSLTNKNN